jgi:hypothetical protein
VTYAEAFRRQAECDFRAYEFLAERLNRGDGVPFLDFLRKLIAGFDKLPWPQAPASP